MLNFQTQVELIGQVRGIGDGTAVLGPFQVRVQAIQAARIAAWIVVFSSFSLPPV